MRRPFKKAEHEEGDGPLAVKLGSVAGAIMGLLAAQVDVKPYREIVSMLAPVVAVVVTAGASAWISSFREWWVDRRHSRSVKKATDEFQSMIDNVDYPEEVKIKAQKQIALVQMARIDFVADSLNRASRPPSQSAQRRVPKLINDTSTE